MANGKVYLSIGSYLNGELILDLADNTLDYLSNKEIEEAKRLGFQIQHAKVCNEQTRKALEFGKSLDGLNSENLPTSTVDAVKQRALKIIESDGVFNPEKIDKSILVPEVTDIEPDSELSMKMIDALYDRHENNVRTFIKTLDKQDFIDYMGYCGLKRKTLGKDDFGEYCIELLSREEAANEVIKKYDKRDSMHEIVSSIKDIGGKVSFIPINSDKVNIDVEAIIANNLCFVLQQKINGSTSFICTNNKQIMDVMYGENVVETLYAYPATKSIVNEPHRRSKSSFDNGSFKVFSGSLRVKDDKDEPYISSLQYTVVPDRVSALLVISDIKYNDLVKRLNDKVIMPNLLTFNGTCDKLYYNAKEFEDLRSAISSGYVESYLSSLIGTDKDYIKVVSNRINKMKGVLPNN